MVGIGLPSSRIDHYRAAIDAGQLLLMVNVARDRVDEIEECVKQHHPEAKLEGIDPHIPIFP
jgi:hypothetical protein